MAEVNHMKILKNNNNKDKRQKKKDYISPSLRIHVNKFGTLASMEIKLDLLDN